MPRIAPTQPFYPFATPDPRPLRPVRPPASQPPVDRPGRLSQRQRETLARGRSAEILRRLEDGDPLELARRVEAFLERRSLLLDHSRVLARAWLLLAREGERLGYRAFTSSRIEACVARAVESVMNAADACAPGPRFQALARELRLSARGLARACDELNRRPRVEREAFFALVIEGRRVESLLRPGGPTAPRLVAAARRALAPFLEVEGRRHVGAEA